MKENKLTQEVIQTCREKLVKLRSEIINRVRAAKLDFDGVDKSSGDEADQTVAQLAENNFILSQNRLREQLVEIEQALSRIETGNFGICEETDEIIEVDRLLTIPWTRLSLEGAELREQLTKKTMRSFSR